jgi:TRAP-type C4-dicarboxylate transport system substrate-binding protein
MKKNRILVLFGSMCLALILAALPLKGAYAEPGPMPEKPIVLKIGSWMPEKHVTSSLTRWFAEQVTKRTGGRVQFKHFYGGALGGAKTQMDNLKAGLFHIAPWIGAVAPAKMPLWNYYLQPWVSSPDLTTRQMIYREMAKLPELKEEAVKWDAKWLCAYNLAEIKLIYTADKPVYKLDDLKGLKIMATGGVGKALRMAGASVVAMPWPDLYDALSKGVVTGAASALPTYMGYKLYEVMKYRTNLMTGLGHPMYFIKLSTFNNLPPDIQKIIMDVARDITPYLAGEESKFVKKAFETFKAQGVTVIKFPKGEQRKYEELYVGPVIEEWVKKVEARRLPGRKIMEAFRATVAKHAK